MFVIRMAELNIGIDNKYDYIENFCSHYIVNSDKTDFTVSASDFEIESERAVPENPVGYLEALAIYRKIADKIIEYDGFLFHAAVLDFCGEGIAFLAKSGVGKSTHIKLWKSLFGNKALVVNGDKPIVRKIDGVFYAYGTPWAGKEGWQANTKTELKKICFLKRATENKTEKIEKEGSLNLLLGQIYIKKDKSLYLSELLDLVGELINSAEFYRVECNTDLSAAKIAYKGMFEYV